MSENDILEMLKINLMISTDAYDNYLRATIKAAKGFISDEGINLNNSAEDSMLVVMYAAYLYAKRNENTPMMRSLRWALNNRLMREKGRVSGNE